jgi:hypothetical protein
MSSLAEIEPFLAAASEECRFRVRGARSVGFRVAAAASRGAIACLTCSAQTVAVYALIADYLKTGRSFKPSGGFAFSVVATCVTFKTPRIHRSILS